MKRPAILAGSVLLLSVAVAGCFSKPPPPPPPAPPKVFDIVAVSWTDSARVYDEGGWLYWDADPGYTWLRFELRITNRTSTTRCLNAFGDAFYYIHGTTRYSRQLAFGPPGLPDCWQPGQTLDGYIYFEVLTSILPPTGQILFQGASYMDAEGQTVIIDVKGLPRE